MGRGRSRRSQGWGGVHRPGGGGGAVAAPRVAGARVRRNVLCIYLPQPTVDAGTSLSRCQAQAALAEVQPLPGSRELQLTFLWQQHKASIMKSPSKYGLWGVCAGTPGGGMPTRVSPRPVPAAAWAALFLATETFQDGGGLGVWKRPRESLLSQQQTSTLKVGGLAISEVWLGPPMLWALVLHQAVSQSRRV